MFQFLFAALGTGLSMYSAHQQGKQEQAQYRYQAKVAEENQRSLQYESHQEAEEVRSKYRRFAGSQLAAAARSGTTVDGSRADLFNDTKIQQEKDIMTMMYKTKQGIINQENEKSLLRSQSANAGYSAHMNMIGAAAKGAGKMISVFPTIE